MRSGAEFRGEPADRVSRHPDLVYPLNRIRAWVDAVRGPVRAAFFGRYKTPRRPGADTRAPSHWHGLMVSAVCAGNGWLGHGFYRGLASDAELVLVQVRDEAGRITNASIARALRWLHQDGPGLGVRVVCHSVAGDPVVPFAQRRATPRPSGNGARGHHGRRAR